MTPENWEYVGKPEYGGRGGQRYRNECGLWLVIEGSKVVTWVGNFHFAVTGTKEEIARVEGEEEAKEIAQEWMEDHPDPWENETEGS